jgi:hypothetical protein
LLDRDVAVSLRHSLPLSLRLPPTTWGIWVRTVFIPCLGFFVIQFVTLRPPMCWRALEPRRVREAACGRVQWLK